MTTPARSASSWQIGLALTSLAAGAIHFAVTGDHFQEGVAFGVFFAALAWAQALWAVGVLMMPSRLLIAAGVAGNLAVVAIWAVSRTTGLPFGPAAGTAEPVGVADVAATILELIIVTGAGVLLGHRALIEGRRVRLSRALPLTVAVMGVTSAAIFAGADHSHVDPAHEHAAEPHAHDQHAESGHGAHGHGAHGHGAHGHGAHGHHMVGGSGEPDPAQIARIRQAMQDYRQVATAAAAGWEQAHRDLPRIGSHYYRGGDWNGPFPTRSGLDIGDPEFLMYSKLLTGEWQLVAVAYVVDQAEHAKPPTVLTGAVYHEHSWNCVANGEELEADEWGVVSRRACRALDGRWAPGGVWMTHVWLVDNPNGVFAETNPVLTAT
jgi:hypothetical protein